MFHNCSHSFRKDGRAYCVPSLLVTASVNVWPAKTTPPRPPIHYLHVHSARLFPTTESRRKCPLPLGFLQVVVKLMYSLPGRQTLLWRRPLKTPPLVPLTLSSAGFYCACREFYVTLWENAPSALFWSQRWSSVGKCFCLESSEKVRRLFWSFVFEITPSWHTSLKLALLVFLCLFFFSLCLSAHKPFQASLMTGSVWGRLSCCGGIHCKALQSRLYKSSFYGSF